MSPWVDVLYLLCFLTSLSCCLLLIRSYRRNQKPECCYGPRPASCCSRSTTCSSFSTSSCCRTVDLSLPRSGRNVPGRIDLARRFHLGIRLGAGHGLNSSMA